MSLRDVRYILIDLNGTLVVEDNLRYDEVLEGILHCHKRGRRLTTKDLREVAKGKLSLSDIISKLYIVEDPDAVSRQLIKVKVSRTILKERTLGILSKLREKYCLLLCSDTTGVAKEVMRNLNLSDYFLRAFYSCDLGYLKSEIGFWSALLSHFPTVKAHEFLMVGDNSRADVYFPRFFGMHTVLVENLVIPSYDYRETTTTRVEENPEFHVKELIEILPLLGMK